MEPLKKLQIVVFLAYKTTLSSQMVLKYRFNLKDIKLEDFKVYLLAMFKAILPKKKINNLDDLEDFVPVAVRVIIAMIVDLVVQLSLGP